MNDNVREAVAQWKAKAKSDWNAVKILLESAKGPKEVICFHCQQYVEKLLKSLLTLHGVEAPKTHDIRRLIQLAEPHAPELSDLADRADQLTSHGVQSRYPDDWRVINDDEMNQMVELAKEFGEILIQKLEK